MRQIRAMSISDLDEIDSLEQEIFKQSSWTKEDYLNELQNNPFAFYFVVEQDNVIVGYAGLAIAYENAEILTIATHPDYRRQNIAKMMMDYMISQVIQANCLSFSLEVRQSNIPAIALYESYGFKKVAQRPNYYLDGESADLMIKEMGEKYDFIASN